MTSNDNLRTRAPRRPSPAFVVACIALFVALAGTAFASGSVSSTQVQRLTAAQQISVPAHSTRALRVPCASGHTLVNGGGGFNTSTAGAYVVTSYPSQNGWYVKGRNNATFAQTLVVVANCNP